MFKEVNRLGYLYSPITGVSAPAAGVFFILTPNPSLSLGSLWPEVLPLHYSSEYSTEGPFTPYVDLGVYFEK